MRGKDNSEYLVDGSVVAVGVVNSYMHDLQVHTNWSDGYHSIAQNLDFARAMHLDAIAITDHYFPDSKIHDPAGRNEYLREISAHASAKQAENEQSPSTLVYAGVEATALDSGGSFSIDAAVAALFDWVLCDLSHYSEGTLSETPDSSTYRANVLRTYHAMCDAEFIDVISHPFNTGNTDPPLLPSSYAEQEVRELADHMAESSTVFDIMNLMPFWFDRGGTSMVRATEEYTDLVRIVASRGVLFQLSSDDHRSGVGNTRWSELVRKSAGVSDDQLVTPGRRLPATSVNQQ